MNNLTIKGIYDDHYIGLAGRVENNGFSGFGEGYFNVSTVQSFCEDLKTMTNVMSGSVELIGSQNNLVGSEYLETLALRCYVLSASKINGVVGVHITLSDQPSTDCRREEIRTFSGEFQIRNHKLHEFAEQLSVLITSPSSEVVLIGDLNMF